MVNQKENLNEDSITLNSFGVCRLDEYNSISLQAVMIRPPRPKLKAHIDLDDLESYISSFLKQLIGENIFNQKKLNDERSKIRSFNLFPTTVNGRSTQYLKDLSITPFNFYSDVDDNCGIILIGLAVSGTMSSQFTTIIQVSKDLSDFYVNRKRVFFYEEFDMYLHQNEYINFISKLLRTRGDFTAVDSVCELEKDEEVEIEDF